MESKQPATNHRKADLQGIGKDDEGIESQIGEENLTCYAISGYRDPDKSIIVEKKPEN